MCVQVDGRVRVGACVCTFTGRARARKQGRLESTLIGLISVRAKRHSTKKVKKGRVVQK